MAANFEVKKKQIIEALNCLSGVSKEMRELFPKTVSSAVTKSIQESVEKIEKNNFNVLVIGAFKRGKSTFLNALLEKNILPSDVNPATAICCVLQGAETPSATVRFRDNSEKEVSIDELNQYVTEEGNKGNEKEVDMVHIKTTSRFLSKGISLVDTPGTGSVYEAHDKVARSFLPIADAVITLVSSDPPISQGEIDFLGEVKMYVERFFVLQNKIDVMAEESWQKTMEFSKNAIEQYAGVSIKRMYPLSSQMALGARIFTDNDLADACKLSETGDTNSHQEIEDMLTKKITPLGLKNVIDSIQNGKKSLPDIQTVLLEKSRILDFEKVLWEFLTTGHRGQEIIGKGLSDFNRYASTLLEIVQTQLGLHKKSEEELNVLKKECDEKVGITRERLNAMKDDIDNDFELLSREFAQRFSIFKSSGLIKSVENCIDNLTDISKKTLQPAIESTIKDAMNRYTESESSQLQNAIENIIQKTEEKFRREFKDVEIFFNKVKTEGEELMIPTDFSAPVVETSGQNSSLTPELGIGQNLSLKMIGGTAGAYIGGTILLAVLGPVIAGPVLILGLVAAALGGSSLIDKILGKTSSTPNAKKKEEIKYRVVKHIREKLNEIQFEQSPILEKASELKTQVDEIGESRLKIIETSFIDDARNPEEIQGCINQLTELSGKINSLKEKTNSLQEAA